MKYYITAPSNDDPIELARYNEGVVANIDDLYKEVYRITDYGAKADGVTDSTTAIQNAIDAMDSGDEMVIPDGTFIATAITVDEEIRISGRGIIKQKDAAAVADTPFISVTASNVQISGITIDGDKANQGAVTGAHLIQFGNGADNGVVDNCVLQNSTGICVRGLSADNLRISNNRFTNWQAGNVSAIYIDSVNGNAAVNGVNIVGNYVDGSSSNSTGIKVQGNATRPIYDAITDRNFVIVGDDGVGTLGIEYWGGTQYGVIRGVIANNTVKGENNTNTTIFGLSVAGAGCREITVSCNSVTDCRVFGIEVAASYKCTIVGNAVYQTGTAASYKPGFTANECVECCYTGNTVSNYFIGIHVYTQDFQDPNCNDNVFVGNSFTLPASTAGYAFWLQCNDAAGVMKRNLISSNSFVGDGTASQYGIVLQQDSGSLDNTVITGNLFYNLPVGINHASDTNTQIILNHYKTVTTLTGGTPGAGRNIGLVSWDGGYIGNGANVNVQAPALGTGSGPATPQTVVNYEQITKQGSIFYIPLMQ